MPTIKCCTILLIIQLVRESERERERKCLILIDRLFLFPQLLVSHESMPLLL